MHLAHKSTKYEHEFSPKPRILLHANIKPLLSFYPGTSMTSVLAYQFWVYQSKVILFAKKPVLKKTLIFLKWRGKEVIRMAKFRCSIYVETKSSF